MDFVTFQAGIRREIGRKLGHAPIIESDERRVDVDVWGIHPAGDGVQLGDGRTSGQGPGQVDGMDRRLVDEVVQQVIGEASSVHIGHALVEFGHDLGDGSPLLDQAARLADQGMETAVPADQHLRAGSVGGVAKPLGLRAGQPGRLLQQRVDPGLDHRQRAPAVQVGRRRDDRQIQFLIRQHIPDVFIPSRNGVLGSHPVSQFLHRIAHGHEPQVVEGLHGFDMTPPPAAAPDQGGFKDCFRHFKCSGCVC